MARKCIWGFSAILDSRPSPSPLVSASSWVVDFCASAKASCCFCTVVCNSFSSSCDFVGSLGFFQEKKSLLLIPVLKIQTTKNTTKIVHVHKPWRKLPPSCLVDVAKAAFTFVTVAWGFSKWRWPVSESLGRFFYGFLSEILVHHFIYLFSNRKVGQGFCHV